MKILNKYNQFLNLKPINENLDKAKKFLKQRYLTRQAAEELGLIKGELKAQLDHAEKKTVTLNDFTKEEQDEIKKKVRELKISDEQVHQLERDPEFLKLRELLSDNIGYLYNFTYMYYVEMTPLEEIQRLYNKILEYRDLMDKLPKKFDANFIDPNVNNTEKLEDGLDSLENYRKVKRIVDRLPNYLKREYRNAAETIKNNFDEVASAFYELGKDDDGNVSEEKRDALWETFFGGIRRYRTLNDFIRAAQNYLKASANSDTVAFYKKINDCNDKFGIAGADIVFDEAGILIIEVKSFAANQLLNSHTRHCIASYAGHWNSYTGDRNKQYYIYNFNIPQYDNKSVIGITIEPGQRINTAHDKADGHVARSFKDILKTWERQYHIGEDLWSYFKPMTQEEIEKRERAKIAERKIVEKGLTIEQIIKYVKEDGANINKNDAIALTHAVEENDIEKAKVILELGASPNLKKGADAPISKAKNLDMIKLLVSYGSEMTGDVFNNIAHDTDALEYCLKAGLDPNFQNSLPFRRVCKGSFKSKDDIGESYLDSLKILLKYGAKITDPSRGRNMLAKWAAENGRIEIFEYLKQEGLSKDWDNKIWQEAISWIAHSRKLNDADTKRMVDYLQAQMK